MVMPMALAAVMICRVNCLSPSLASRLPAGWLWERMSPVAPRSSERLRISQGRGSLGGVLFPKPFSVSQVVRQFFFPLALFCLWFQVDFHHESPLIPLDVEYTRILVYSCILFQSFF